MRVVLVDGETAVVAAVWRRPAAMGPGAIPGPSRPGREQIPAVGLALSGTPSV